ncbi:SUMF1/EgtB/PvdO family nonheme iron enzyme [Dactylosporangium sp. NPDC049525]|uniref:SUMF1/EgtB/PvdO family nonheme iron enzyme n=1 Tax=Dactylosporangium sp. NPDC049525 TaxID=3154730 RepID=UPI00343448FC
MTERRRLAVVLGSNGPATSRIKALQYARRDAERFAAALASPECGFTVTSPSPEADVAEALAVLERVAESCDDTDEFVCYFSGHGVLLNGTLVLLWHHTDLDRAPLGTAIPVARVMTALAFCKARNRLLVLDCCHAGAAAALLGLKSAAAVPFKELDLGLTSANYLVLLASDRLEQARELDSLGGSFMTASLCAGLEQRPDEADGDGDGRLSVQDLANWLAIVAGRQNTTGEVVPVPYLAGQSRGPFHLTREPEWPVWKVQLPSGGTATLLPGLAAQSSRQEDRWPDALVAIADHPVTNQQFREFVDDTQEDPPTGQEFVNGAWRGPFEPWSDARFDADGRPVVCVDAERARQYCRWLAGGARGVELTGPDGERRRGRIVDVDLPTSDEWDSAYLAGSRSGWRGLLPFARRGRPRFADSAQRVIHDQSNAPADAPAANRANRWGIVDLLGNVWEWCYSRYGVPVRRQRPPRPQMSIMAVDDSDFDGDRRFIDRDFEIRGGGFLDDVSANDLGINAALLAEGMGTSHTDLGFRIVVLVQFDDEPPLPHRDALHLRRPPLRGIEG